MSETEGTLGGVKGYYPGPFIGECLTRNNPTHVLDSFRFRLCFHGRFWVRTIQSEDKW